MKTQRTQIKTFHFIFLFVISSLGSIAQIPDGYYTNANGLTGNELRTALHDIISKDSKKIPYGSGYLNGIWGAFQYTDVFPFPNQTRIWDMYSDVPDGTASYYFVLGTNQCGNASQEGDCYSREHSFPKSYWGGGGQTGSSDPQYTDLFHLVPADQYVNNRRSNYPYGEVSNPTWTSTNGGKLGPNAFSPSYTGTAFEPIDEYKGDLARGYLYLATRYMDVFASWEKITQEGDVIINGNNFSAWFLEMLLKWNNSDTVSQKEIDRNNAVFYNTAQGNRNPFIDHPEFVGKVWQTTHVTDRRKDFISVYPNPAKTQLTLVSDLIGYHFTVFNVMGVKVIEGLLTDVNLPLGDLRKGHYLLQLQSPEFIINAPFILN